MRSLTQPLGFRQHLKTAPANALDPVPFLDVLLVAALLALQSSRFVLAPGASIELPQINETLDLATVPPVVLTVDRNGLFFFQGKKLNQGQVAGELGAYAGKLEDANPVLLLQADSSIPAELLFQLFESARMAGVERIQLAAEEELKR